MKRLLFGLLCTLVVVPAAAQDPVPTRRLPLQITVDSASVRATLARPEIAGALRRLPIRVDSAAVVSHVLRPAHVVDVVAYEGPDRDGAAPARSVFVRLDSARIAAVLREPGVSVVAQPRQRLTIGATPVGPRLDVPAFVAELHETMKDSVAGYMMQLRRNGQTIATLQWNWSRRPSEGGLGWLPERRMHVASVSKLITSIALVRLLHERNISLDAPIAGHLPTVWARGPGIGQITFRHLLTHESGIRVTPQYATDWWTMRNVVRAGVPADSIGRYGYENANFGLMRVLIPVINGDVPRDLFPLGSSPGPTPNLSDQIWDLMSVNAYENYVRARVLAPSGVSTTAGSVPLPGKALAYRFGSTQAGWNSGNLRSVTGGAGWILSVSEVLNVLGAFRRGTLVPVSVAQQALDGKLGIDQAIPVPNGTLYNKNGAWGTEDGRVEQSLAYILPENMELVLFANSGFGIRIGKEATSLRGVVNGVYLNNVR
jgi:hypothetical protein